MGTALRQEGRADKPMRNRRRNTGSNNESSNPVGEYTVNLMARTFVRPKAGRNQLESRPRPQTATRSPGTRTVQDTKSQETRTPGDQEGRSFQPSGRLKNKPQTPGTRHQDPGRLAGRSRPESQLEAARGRPEQAGGRPENQDPRHQDARSNMLPQADRSR